MAGMLIPDGIIEDGFQKAIEFIRNDYNDVVDKTKSLLVRITDNQTIGSFNYTEQMVESLITTEKSARHIRVQQGYNPNDRKYPGIYVNLAEENDDKSSLGQGIGDHGLGDGQDDGYFDDVGTPNATLADIFAGRYTANYYLTMLSDNRNEMIGLYHFFKALGFSIRDHFEQSGLQNIKYTGQSPVFDDRIPSGVYIRVLKMNFNYETYTHDFYKRVVPSTINLTGTIIES